MTEEINQMPTAFGYELIRDHVLTSVLGKHEADILYWAGKELARKFPSSEIEALPTFFKKAGWGRLTLEKMTDKEVVYHLHIDKVVAKANQRTHQLEAGFLAEQYQNIQQYITECHAKVSPRKALVALTIAWDPKEIVEKNG